MSDRVPLDGFDLARAMGSNPELVRTLELLKNEMLIVMLKRLGGKAEFPVAEVDDTARDTLLFAVIDGVFHFEIRSAPQ